MNKDKNPRTVNVANSKIVKGEIDATLAAGNTHAQFRNKGVQKRLLKNQQKVRRRQDQRDNALHLKNKRAAEAKENAAALMEKMNNVAAHQIDERAQALRALVAETPGQAASRAMRTIAGAVRLRDSVVISGNLRSVEETVMSTPPEPGPAEEVHPMTFADGTIDTNTDPRNFGRQPVNRELPTADKVISSNFEFPMIGAGIEEAAAKASKVIYPLNLYGDENTYKPFPEIGEYVREDGLLMALRTLPENVKPTIHDVMCGEVNNLTDTRYYATPGTFVDKEVFGIIGSDEHRLVAKYKARADILNCDVNKSYPDLVEEINLDAPGMEEAKKHFLDMANSGQGSQADWDKIKEEVEKANTVTQKDIQQSFPYHPQEDGPFSPAAFMEGVSGYKVQNSGISGMTPDPEVLARAEEAMQRVANKLHVSMAEVGGYKADIKVSEPDSVEIAIARQLAEGKDVSQIQADEFTALLDGFTLAPIADPILVDKPDVTEDGISSSTPPEGFIRTDVHGGNTVIPKVVSDDNQITDIDGKPLTGAEVVEKFGKYVQDYDVAATYSLANTTAHAMLTALFRTELNASSEEKKGDDVAPDDSFSLKP